MRVTRRLLEEAEEQVQEESYSKEEVSVTAWEAVHQDHRCGALDSAEGASGRQARLSEARSYSYCWS